MTYFRVSAAVLFLMLAACGGGGGNSNPASPGVLLGCASLRAGVFSGTVNGSPWSAGDTLPIAGLVAVSAVIAQEPAISIAGVSCDDVEVGFAYRATVTRDLDGDGILDPDRVGDGSGLNATYIEDSRDPATAQKIWRAISSLGGSGSVTVTSASGTRASGTFSFTLAPFSGGASGARQVTGVFDVKLPCPPPSCAGSQ